MNDPQRRVCWNSYDLYEVACLIGANHYKPFVAAIFVFHQAWRISAVSYPVFQCAVQNLHM